MKDSEWSCSEAGITSGLAALLDGDGEEQGLTRDRVLLGGEDAEQVASPSDR